MLTQRATLLQEALNHVAAMQRTWRQTRDAAHAARAPAPILQQIDAALAEIQAAETPLEAQRAAVLDLQAVVAHEVARSGTALAQFTEAQQRAIGGVFVRDSAARVERGGVGQARAAVPGRLREVASTAGRTSPGTSAIPSSGNAVACRRPRARPGLALTAVRRRVRQLAATPEGAPAATAVFDRPYAATVVLALIVVAAPNSPVPLTVRGLFEVLGLSR